MVCIVIMPVHFLSNSPSISILIYLLSLILVICPLPFMGASGEAKKVSKSPIMEVLTNLYAFWVMMEADRRELKAGGTVLFMCFFISFCLSIIHETCGGSCTPSSSPLHSSLPAQCFATTDTASAAAQPPCKSISCTASHSKRSDQMAHRSKKIVVFWKIHKGINFYIYMKLVLHSTHLRVTHCLQPS